MPLFKCYKKYFSCIIISILVLIIFATHFTYPAINVSYRTSLLEQMEKTNDFHTFTNCLFCYEVTTDSITTAYTLKNPETYNIPKLTPTLTNFSSTKKETNSNLYEIIQNSLSRYQENNLSVNDRLTCQLLENTLALNASLDQYPYYQELLGATTGVQANLPVTLGEYPLRDIADIKTYLNLLTQVPDYFNNVIQYETTKKEKNLSQSQIIYPETLKNMNHILSGLENKDNSFIQTFNERIDRISSLTDFQKNYYKKKNERYVKKYLIPSYKKLQEFLSKEAGNQTSLSSTMNKTDAYGLSSLPYGKEYYTLLVKQATGSSKSVNHLTKEIETRLNTALNNVLTTAINNPSLYDSYVNKELPSYWNTPENTLYALSLLTKKDYPNLSDTPAYKIKNVSQSLSSSLSPAFYMIPAIDDISENTIYINPLYTNTQNGNLFTTLAHEGFPGHLYQTCYFYETNPNLIRHLLSYPGYVEGWATYVEIESYKYLDYPEEKEALQQLYQGDTIISLALSSRIDIGVNYENWTLQDVEQYFEQYGFQTYYAKELYQYVVEAPANYLSYFIGYCEIQELKEQYRDIQGINFNEKDFHTAFLNLGPCDYKTAKEFLFSEKK
ncbi:MAG: DUF885 domain-containing protein [Lachnospiraceae bacterium]